MKKSTQVSTLILSLNASFFDVKENHKGKYLRITELSGGRSCIVIPLGGINLFKERLGEIIDEAEGLIDAPQESASESSSPFVSSGN